MHWRNVLVRLAYVVNEIRLKCVIYHEITLLVFERSKIFVFSSSFFKEENTTLRVLDLQWNHIRKESAAALCKCLSVRNMFRPCQRHHLSQCRVAYHIKLIFQTIFINKKKILWLILLNSLKGRCWFLVNVI